MNGIILFINNKFSRVICTSGWVLAIIYNNDPCDLLTAQWSCPGWQLHEKNTFYIYIYTSDTVR